MVINVETLKKMDVFLYKLEKLQQVQPKIMGSSRKLSIKKKEQKLLED